ncbi:ATP-dependent helicase HrpB [Paenibacillus silviterrae]|uniref:ATP-dependent helicase HrpB n=1 Tax=Paenibacillus silviterrae TaxID=3242194 RepID=UPI00254352F5|nr:ATP-dependent helicase HrpB [Paenibacillus chinjuensis]
MLSLPIDEVLPQVKEALLNHTSAVLIAEPGAGKTTQVPLSLLEEPWLRGKRIIMLEPRRLAARAAARYMAAKRKEQVGETVGYRVRLDTKISKQTRIEVVTEGVLTRMLQNDPALEGVGLVIFDEFHERSLHADLGLAFVLQAQALLREDLRILVMSATMQAEPVASLLGDAPILSSKGRMYPVETHYLSARTEERLEVHVADAVQRALANEEGDIMVFLPGSGEIRRTENQLRERRLGEHVRIAPLYGILPQEQQERAIAPSIPGERKIVLATSIAETSLTVEGIKVVIDSGLMRVSRFSPRTGMSRLDTVPVSKASADQRRGRAGRLGPGVCYRLWTKQEQDHLAERSTPEILDADLTPLLLELAAWGITEPSELDWLDVPPAPAVNQARELLTLLGAIRDDGTITDIGKRMVGLAAHPRLAHMMLMGQERGLANLACDLAAILSDRDMFGSGLSGNADLRLRVEALRGSGPHLRSADASARERMLAEARAWKRELGSSSQDEDHIDHCGLLLAYAYPDRIAQRRETGKFLLSNGRGAAFAQLQPLSQVSYLVAAQLDDQGADSRILLAAPVQLKELQENVSDWIQREELVSWDSSTGSVRAVQREKLGSLILREGSLPQADPDRVASALVEGIALEGLELLPWNRASRQLQQRIRFLHRFDSGSWPDVRDEALLGSLEEWLKPHILGLKNRAQLERLKLTEILESMLTWEQRRQLDSEAPTHVTVPSGSRIAVDYSQVEQPVVSVKLQEVFGWKDTPRLARGRVPVLLHLLSPAQRPVQVTKDLASFWSSTYFDVKKDLKGRYPKHYWPDDPLTALPTNRVRPKV